MNLLNIPESIVVQLDGLNAAYLQAAASKNYKLCDMLRIEIQRVLTGKKLLIPVENSLSPSFPAMPKNYLC